MQDEFHPFSNMGSSTSSQNLEEEKRKRGKLEEELQDVDHSLRVTASCHYESAERYKRIDHIAQYVSLVVMPVGCWGAAVSKLAWETLVKKYPRSTPALAALSAVSALSSLAVNFPIVPNSPRTLYKTHFKAGIECQYLQKRVRFMAETTVWDLSRSWGEIASKYEQLLKEKKEVNGSIQTEEWAYLKAVEKIREKDERKRQKKSQNTK